MFSITDVGDVRWFDVTNFWNTPREVKKRQRVSESMKFLLAQEGEGRKLLWKMITVDYMNGKFSVHSSIPYVCACLFLEIRIKNVIQTLWLLFLSWIAHLQERTQYMKEEAGSFRCALLEKDVIKIDVTVFLVLCTGTCKARGVHEGLRYEPSRTATRGRDVTFTGPPCGWQKEALCGISCVREMVESFGRCKKGPRFSFPLWGKWWRKLKVFYGVWSWNATQIMIRRHWQIFKMCYQSCQGKCHPSWVLCWVSRVLGANGSEWKASTSQAKGMA